MLRLPDVPTTAEQWKAIAWATIILLLIGGAGTLYFAIARAAKNPAAASGVRMYAFGMWGAAGLVYAIKRLIGAWLE